MSAQTCPFKDHYPRTHCDHSLANILHDLLVSLDRWPRKCFHRICNAKVHEHLPDGPGALERLEDQLLVATRALDVSWHI